MPDFRQHDVTDCGAACLAYVFHHHGLQMSLSVIRQKAGTNRSGTTALGLVDTAKQFDFEAKGLRCKFEDLKSVALPGIAHVVTENGRSHYVVVTSIRKKTVHVMDPAIGKVAKWPIDQFRAVWTNVFLVLAPSMSFQPSKQTDSAWSRLCRLLYPQRAVIAQAFVGVVLTTLLSLSTAVFIQKIVDNVIVDGNRNLLRLLGVAMLLILGARILIGYFQSILLLRSAQRIDAGLLLGYYRHLMRLPQSFFDTMRVGEITARMRDAVAVREFLNGTIINLIINPLILIVALSAMFAYSWRLAVFSLLLIPANALIYLASDWLNRRYQREIMERSADFDSQVVESLHAMSVVRSCGIEDEMNFRSETRLVRVLKSVWTSSRAGFAIGSTGGLVTQAYSIGLLWIGAGLVLDSQLTAGELMSCNALAGYITGPIVGLIGMNASIRGATTATDRLYEILDLEREQDEGVSKLNVEAPFDLELDHVDFRYPGRAATLSDLSLTLTSGTITALVGKSGCGKTTVLSLLQRHYEAERGQIRIAGVDLHQIKLSALRRHIAFVPQKIDLLAGTVLENLAPHEPQPDLQRITELCRTVGVLEFVESLPRGFQTLITENGANLSGGQKQRIAIVRALYSDAPIILMDEPSSALDAESEDMLVAVLESMRAQQKLVVLAVHNERLLQICDRVIRLEVGRIVEDQSTERVARAAATPALPEYSDPDKTAGGDSLPQLVDPDATAETQSLFRHLLERSAGGILVGQTDTNVMGVTADERGWFLEEGRSDFEIVTGKKPATYGFDIPDLSAGWARACGFIAPKIREAHAANGVIIVTWHPENFALNQDVWSGCGVAESLPGGPAHAALRQRLDQIADNIGNLVDNSGASIPILFHAWQQPNADHFWWGRSRCSAAEYQRLFRFTVSYLRDIRRVGNFLYCFSPSRTGDPLPSYWDRFPGADFVDVIGLDWFGDESPEAKDQLLRQSSELIRFAESHGKVAGITELGYYRDQDHRGLKHCGDPDWLDHGVMFPLADHPVTQRLSFINFWRNEAHNPSVYNLPPPGSAHAACFQRLAETRGPYRFGDEDHSPYQLWPRALGKVAEKTGV